VSVWQKGIKKQQSLCLHHIYSKGIAKSAQWYKLLGFEQKGMVFKKNVQNCTILSRRTAEGVPPRSWNRHPYLDIHISTAGT